MIQDMTIRQRVGRLRNVMSTAADVEQLRRTWVELGMDRNMAAELGAHIERGRDLDAIIDVASTLRQQRLYHEALVTYELGERWFPNDRYIWNNRGVVNRDWGRLTEAVAAFERALQIEPQYAKALEGRSECQLLRGDFAAAVTGFRAVLEKHPDQADTWRNFALALAAAGDSAQALEAYEHSLALAPNHTQTLFDYAGTLAQAGRPGDAIEVLDRLLAIDGNDSDARAWRKRLQSSPQTPLDVQYPSPPKEISVVRIRRTKQDLDRVAELVNAAIASGEKPAAKPPRLFVSYRWDREGQDAWVTRLVQSFESRGYDVIFDRAVQSRAREPLPVPDLVALMTGCTHFVPILTEGYRRRVETRPSAAVVIEDGWVWDEYQIALRLAAARRVIFQGVWRSGPVVPNPFVPENVCDFRDDAAFDARIEEHFPVRMACITGLRSDGTDRRIGPFPRTEINRFGRQLEATGEFDRFIILHL